MDASLVLDGGRRRAGTVVYQRLSILGHAEQYGPPGESPDALILEDVKHLNKVSAVLDYFGSMTLSFSMKVEDESGATVRRRITWG